MKTITFHSTRGGVGKTIIAMNLALTYASQNHNVCLIDFDFRAPRLSTILEETNPQKWVNDFLNGQASLEETLVDVSDHFNTSGLLRIGLIDPALVAIRNLALKDRRWHRRLLQKLLTAKTQLTNHGVDFLILDTSPGLVLSSVNAVATADTVIIVTTADHYDLHETQQMSIELYQAFDKPTFVVMNKVHPSFQWNTAEYNQLHKQFTARLQTPIIRIIPCFCDLLQTKIIDYVITQPEHLFSHEIHALATSLID
jgi:MinD-like ATPase involved in chromosome partitioning or flagellar assembly